MKERRKITEVIVKQSAEISSIIPNEDGSLFLIDIEGKLVEHELHQGVGYLRSSGTPKIRRCGEKVVPPGALSFDRLSGKIIS